MEPQDDEDEAADDFGRDAAGHAAHFLSRLDRVAAGEVELALSLYNDVPLLAEVLARARIADTTPRVAIALKDGGRGPHIVVTRDAKFVTCLGEGMTTNDLPIIARGQLDAFAHHVESLRAKIAMSERLTGSGAPTTKLLERVFTAGPALSREEFLAVAAWLPIVRGTALIRVTEAMARHARDAERLRHVERVTPKNAARLRALWGNMWSAGHLLMVLASGARETCAALEALSHESRGDTLEVPELATFSVAATGALGLTMRAAYFGARCGKALAGRHKKRLLASLRPDDLLASFAILGCTAHRHQGLSAEIRKAFAASADKRPPPPGIARMTEDDKRHLFRFTEDFLSCYRADADRGFDDPEAAMERARALGRMMAKVLSEQRSGPDAPFHFDSPEDVPDGVALALLASSGAPALEGSEVLFDALPWIARALPEDFYLPSNLVRATGKLTEYPMVLSYLAYRRRISPGRSRAASAAKLGRNDPCSCGSGKKYKRCCG